MAELKRLSRSTALDDLTRIADVRAELRRLPDAAPICLPIPNVEPGLSIESLPGRGSCVRFHWGAAS